MGHVRLCFPFSSPSQDVLLLQEDSGKDLNAFSSYAFLSQAPPPLRWDGSDKDGEAFKCPVPAFHSLPKSFHPTTEVPSMGELDPWSRLCLSLMPRDSLTQ